MAEQEWRGNVKAVRQQKLDWILANLNVLHYDPYNPIQMSELTREMMNKGVINKNNNYHMQVRSIETLVIQARKIKGFK